MPQRPSPLHSPHFKSHPASFLFSRLPFLRVLCLHCVLARAPLQLSRSQLCWVPFLFVYLRACAETARALRTRFCFLHVRHFCAHLSTACPHVCCPSARARRPLAATRRFRVPMRASSFAVSGRQVAVAALILAVASGALASLASTSSSSSSAHVHSGAGEIIHPVVTRSVRAVSFIAPRNTCLRLVLPFHRAHWSPTENSHIPHPNT